MKAYLYSAARLAQGGRVELGIFRLRGKEQRRKPRKPNAFTLIEVLVVITIIGMLVALLLPAVNGARAAGQKTTCMNNLRNYGQATLAYVSKKDLFPGYRELLTRQDGTKVVVSWQIALLPELDRQDLYQALQSGLAGTTNQPLPYLELAVCPSDSSIAGKSSPATSYVANTGRSETIMNIPQMPMPMACVDAMPPEAPHTSNVGANGLFFDHAAPGISGSNVKVSLTDVKDGASTTLMLSENVDVYNYNDSPVAVISTTNPGQVMSSLASALAYNCSQRNLGFVWWDTSTSKTPPTSLPPSPIAAINGKAGDYDPGRAGWSGPQQTTFAARPSSRHSGGVNTVFVGGNIRFLREDLDYVVYCLLMTPNGAKATVNYNNPNWQKTPVDEGQL
jgi:prepilin-type N-terminal cleavage/methylation domain-containing protein/prepilin-type processing-associated H-X9-DG protein